MSALTFSSSSLTLGTVQLGLDYGIANRDGRPDTGEAEAILGTAIAGGITTLDTARGYGEAEAAIGRWLAKGQRMPVSIVTKFPALPNASSRERVATLKEHVAASQAALGRTRLDLLLAHRETDILDPAIVGTLQELVAKNTVAAFGASLYRPEIALRILETVPVVALQVPANAVDRRFETAGVFRLAREKNVAMFVRSAFLQGALLMPLDELPAHLSDLRKPLALLSAFAKRHARPLAQVLLLMLRDIPGVTSIVLGVDRAEQLRPHLEAIAAPALDEGDLQSLRHEIGSLSDRVLDPGTWPQ